MDVRPEGTPAATFAVRAWTALQGARAAPCGSSLLFAHVSVSLGAASRSLGSTSLCDSRIMFFSSRGSINQEPADMPITGGQTRGLTPTLLTPLAWIANKTDLGSTAIKYNFGFKFQ